MIELFVLAATAQLQTVKLPPPPSAPAANAVPAPVELTGFPDLVISGIRVVDGNPSFEVRNNGGAATAQPVRVRSCAYIGEEGTDKRVCSRDSSAGILAAGEAKWVAVTCFPVAGGPPTYSGSGLLGGVRIPEGGPERCSSARDLGPAWKFSARADATPDSELVPEGGMAPAALQPDCDSSYGCIRELNEGNNRSEYQAPFPG